MSDENLLIKISADAKDVKEAFDNVVVQTADLNEALSKMSEIAGEAFSFFREQIAGSIDAFREADLANRALTSSLQNQGIYTDALKKSYADYSAEVSKATGYDEVQLTKSQAVLQSFIGQIPVTKQLTQAVADLAEQQGISLPQAADELGKAIGSGTGMLLRQGLQFAATDTEAQRYQKTLDFVQMKAGGMAASANASEVSTRALTTAFEESEKELGERFAPAFGAVVKLLTDFIAPAKDGSHVLTDMKAGLLAAGLALSAMGVALPLVAQGFLALRAAAVALEIGMAPILLIPAAIALAIGAIVALALNWDTVSTRIKAIVSGLVTAVSGAFSGLGKVLSGAFHLDPDKIKAGLDEIVNAFKDGATKAVAEIPKAAEKALSEQDAIKKKFADKQAADQRAHDAVMMQLAKAQNEGLKLQLEDASQAQIDLKKQEVEVLKALANKKSGEDKSLLLKQLAEIRAITGEQQAEDLARDKSFQDLELQADEKYYNQAETQDVSFRNKELAKIKANALTEQEANKKVYTDDLSKKIDAHNTFLTEQAKYGTAYAAINQAIHSDEIQGTEQAAGDLVQLAQSKNASLKAIGKAASIAQIVIKTGESAMNVFAGFSEIPFIGSALGMAAAAAVIAFGAEQIGNVTAAADGGLITGGISGLDSVPAMLMPGELVTPEKNFDEVVNAVANERAGTASHDGGGSAVIQLQLKDDLGKIVEAKIIERQRIGISLLPKFT